MQYKSFKIRLEPNNKQLSLFMQHAGVARHAYNQGLSYYNEVQLVDELGIKHQMFSFV